MIRCCLRIARKTVPLFRYDLVLQAIISTERRASPSDKIR
jgi:hypothetical protein